MTDKMPEIELEDSGSKGRYVSAADGERRK